MKSLVATTVEAGRSSGYPEPFCSRVLPREKRALGDAFGLTSIGVSLTVLHPGVESSMRHWHDREDELIYLLEGELVLRTNDSEESLQAGMVVGFKAGDRDAHQFVNRSDRAATYLEISNRDAADVCVYPDVDMAYGTDAEGHNIYVHKDGTPY